jgi:hypothetical protein
MVRPSKVFGPKPQKIALADTKMSINGCQVLMGHPDPAHAQATAKVFKGQLSSVISRAGCVTMGDFYSASIEMSQRLAEGRPCHKMFDAGLCN